MRKRNATESAEKAAKGLQRAIDAARATYAGIIQGLSRNTSHAKKLKLAATLGRALRGESPKDSDEG